MKHRVQEIVRYRSMLWSMILADLRTRYKGSALGFLWTFVNPLLMLMVYALVFSTVLRINLRHYPAFMFIGILAWNMFATGVQSATGVIVRQSSLVNKIYFPREILPLSIVGGSAINYLLSLVILIPFLLINGLWPDYLWLWFPLIFVVEVVLTSGIALMASGANVFIRDLEHMIGVILQLLFYLTPIVYAANMVPHRYTTLLKFNPIADIVLTYQQIFYFDQPPHWKLFVYGAGISLAILLAGWKMFDQLSRRFAEEV